MTPFEKQQQIKAQIAASYNPESSRLTQEDLEKSANNFFEKGGRRAAIGETRMFGGREYIRTASGWKYSGKNKEKHRDATDKPHDKQESKSELHPDKNTAIHENAAQIAAHAGISEKEFKDLHPDTKLELLGYMKKDLENKTNTKKQAFEARLNEGAAQHKEATDRKEHYEKMEKMANERDGKIKQESSKAKEAAKKDVKKTQQEQSSKEHWINDKDHSVAIQKQYIDKGYKWYHSGAKILTSKRYHEGVIVADHNNKTLTHYKD